MIKDFLFMLFKLSHMALQHSLSSLVWTVCALSCTAITSNHSKKSMWIFWCTYAKAHVTVTPSRETAWCFGSLNQYFSAHLLFNSKCLWQEVGMLYFWGVGLVGIFFFFKSKTSKQSSRKSKCTRWWCW